MRALPTQLSNTTPDRELRGTETLEVRVLG